MRALTTLAAVLLVGCASEPKIEEDSIAYRAHGVICDVQMRREFGSRKLSGELLEAREGGLLLLLDNKAGTPDRNRIVLFPFSTLHRTRFEYLGAVSLASRGQQADGVAVARLALLSRFPQGLSPELTSALLAAYGRTEIAIAGTSVFPPLE